MKNNLLLIVIGVTGVVVAIWAALRQKSTPVIVQSSPSLQPLSLPTGQGVTPLGAPPVQQLTPANAPAPSPVQMVQPSAAASGVPQYTPQTQLVAGSAPINAPTPAISRPTFYGSVQGPIMDFINSMVPKSEPMPDVKKSACGCGGSCGGGCKDCSSKCDVNNSRYPDGRGGCLAFNRKKQIEQAVRTNPTGFVRSSDNVLSAGVDMFGVFQQTLFDIHHGRMNDGDTPPASPFLNPV